MVSRCNLGYMSYNHNNQKMDWGVQGQNHDTAYGDTQRKLLGQVSGQLKFERLE